ncbi:MAG: TonB-dependent receptor, partial [Sphingomonadales bacterium]|nr:TonB-dependent receptor [Sphingomonadales bacterium]
FEIPGSATVLDAEDLGVFNYGDANRVLRQVPGVNLQEEDGFGLFPNIGLRGAAVERSANITLMEDGVLIAPAPYAAPAAYYFPQIGRMSAVEIVKGAQAVRYGPRTIGGAINLLSTPIPQAPHAGYLSAHYGEDQTYAVHGWAGGNAGQFSALLETYQAGSDGFKRLDSGGDSGFEAEDYIARIAVRTADGAPTPMSLEFKFGHTNREADETYLGLSDADFAADPFRRYAASAGDRFESDHYQYQLTHTLEAGRAEFVTTAYYNDFARNWFKLNDLNIGTGFTSPNSFFNNPDSAAGQLGLAILRGEADSAPGAIRLRNNNRKYYAAGAQSVMTVPWEWGPSNHILTLSARYHRDEEDRLQHDELFQMLNGQLVRTSVNPIGSNANRESRATAFAFYIQDRIEIGTYEAADGVLLLGSVSRGFSPPGPGSDADAEKSWNYEAGIRFARHGWSASAIGFFNDYANLLGDCTNATGCTAGDIGDQFNGGAVDVIGLEAAVEGAVPLGTGGLSIPVRAAYTWTDAEFRQTFDSEFFGNVVLGDELPYISEHQLYLSAGIAGERFSVILGSNYVSEIRTEAGQGPVPAMERVPDRWVFDLAAHFDLTDNVGLFARVDNLFDEAYAVARRPLGLRPGKPQTIVGGVNFRF